MSAFLLILCTVVVLISDSQGNHLEKQDVRVESNKSVNLTCRWHEKNLHNFQLFKITDSDGTKRLNIAHGGVKTSDDYTTVSWRLNQATPQHNGTYECKAENVENENIRGERLTLIITDIQRPKILSFDAKFVAIGKLYSSWSIEDESNSLGFHEIAYTVKNTNEWKALNTYKARNECLVLDVENRFDATTEYDIKIRVRHKRYATEKLAANLNKPLAEDFKPLLQVRETNNDSITLEWAKASSDLEEYYNYEVGWIGSDYGKEEWHTLRTNSTENYFKISSLHVDISYRFKVRFCIINSGVCDGPWSAEVLAKPTIPPVQYYYPKLFANNSISGEDIPNGMISISTNPKLLGITIFLILYFRSFSFS